MFKAKRIIFNNKSLEYKNAFHEGIRLFQINQFDKSTQIFDKLIEIEPNDSEVLHFRGILAMYDNDLSHAINFISKAIKINPKNAFYYNNLGISYKKLGQIEEAIQNFEKAISINEGFFEALNNKANGLQLLGKTNEAIETYLSAIKLNPNFADAHFNLGNAYRDIKNLKDAFKFYNNTLKILPNHFEALSAMGSLECELENFSNSINFLNKSIEIKPDYAIAHNNLGITYLKIKNFSKALICFDKAIELNPDFVDAYSNKGLAFLNSDNLPQAVECFEKTLALEPRHADALNNYGNAFLKQKNYKKALEYFDKAITTSPSHYANFNKSFTLLLLGKYHEGWKSYEFRLNDKKSFAYNFLPAEKLLKDIRNINKKIILICHEQGLGDTIQFIRYAKLLKDLGANVLALMPKELISLISDNNIVDSVFDLNSNLPHFDFFTPIASLPYLFGTNLSNIPYPNGYLSSNRQKNDSWANRLGVKKKPRIGLTWSSTSKFSDDNNRSIPLSKFVQYLDFDNFEYISLQKVIKEEDQNFFEKLGHIKHFGSDLFDFSETSALANNLDMIISTCTSIPHLTGALGIDTYLILQYNADWRWLIDRNDSPWYKSIKIYRQYEYKNWDPVLKLVADEVFHT